MRLTKKINLFEEFQAEVLNTQKPKVNEVPINKTVNVKPKSVIKTDALKDVDSILNNLETLSAQITEEYGSFIDDFDFLNEADDTFMQAMMKQFKAIKSYAKLKGSYKTLRAQKLKLEVAKADAEAKFDADSPEKTEAALEGIKAKIDNKKKEITASDLPTEKKKQAREKLNQAWEAQEKQVREKIKKQLDAQKLQLSVKFDQEIKGASDKIMSLETENKIETDLLSKTWTAQKLKVDNEQDLAQIQKVSDARLAYDDSDTAEFAEKQAKKAAEQQKKLKQEYTAKQAEALQSIKDAEAEADERAQSGDEKTVAANQKIKTYYKSVQDLLGTLSSQDAESYDDAAKLEVKNKKKAYREAEDKMSPTVFVDGGVTTDKDEAEELLNGMKEDVNASLEDFSSVLDTVDDVKSDTEKVIDDATKEEKALKDALALINKADDPEGYKTKEKEYLTAQIKTQTAKKADAAASDKPTEAFDAKIAELQQKIEALAPEPTPEPTPENRSFKLSGNVKAITESFEFQSASISEKFRKLM